MQRVKLLDSKIVTEWGWESLDSSRFDQDLEGCDEIIKQFFLN